jgi:hypothetical protein
MTLVSFNRFFLIILFILLFFCSGVSVLQAQQTKTYIISGQVIEDESNEPAALINVTIDSLQLGAATNLEGEFNLTVPSGKHKLTVKSIGYEEANIWVEVKDTALTGIEIRLKIPTANIEVVEIYAGENPAHRIIRNAHKNRNRNRIDKLEAYEYESYNKTTVTLNNISQQKLDKSVFLAPTRKFINAHKTDSAIVDSSKKYKLGIFISEAVSNIYYHKPKKKEIIVGRQTTGIENNESNFITALLANVDLYDNYVEILEQQFLSPIAAGALMNYKYYLVDTVFVGQDSIFAIQVVPKRKFDKVFKGMIYIESSTWALKKADLRMNEDPNINFVEGIRIRQEFIKVDSFWMPTIKDIEVDFKNQDNKIGFVGRTATFMKNYVIGKPRPKAFYDGEVIEMKDEAYGRDSSYWLKQRQSPLEQSDKLAYQFMDDLKKRSIWQLIIFINELTSTGRKTVGFVDIGPYSKVIGYNGVEGLRLQIGAATNKKFSKDWYFSGMIAYGVKDDHVKYDLEAAYSFRKVPRITVSASFTHDVQQTGFANWDLDGTGLIYSALMRIPPRKLNYYNQYMLRVRADLFKGCVGMFYAKTHEFIPAFPYYFIENNTLRYRYKTTEVGTSLRFSIRENYILRGGERIYTGSKYPVFFLDYNLGLKKFLGGEYYYHKIAISMSDRLKAGRFGWMNYSATVGQIFGNLPLASLYVFRGSQSLAMDPIGFYLASLQSYLGSRNRSSSFDPVGFNLMYFYEFAADRYAVAGFDHHFEGYIFNKLPLLRWVLHKLKVKEVVSMRFGMGTMTEANRRMNTPENDSRFSGSEAISAHLHDMIRVKTPDKQPYWEVGVGMENILRILRVDFIWRLNYLNPYAPDYLSKYNFNFGVRVYGSISF